jgi:uncharacterized protein (DUF2236 family)
MRAEFALAWDTPRERRYNAIMAMTKAVYPHLPAWFREAPKERYLRDLRRRLDPGER